ncbi:unnamed protein product [Lathyrus oleraceus]
MFSMNKVYSELIEDNTRVGWSHMLRCKYAHPRAVLILWLTCHRRLATQDRLLRFGMIQNSNCSLCCNVDESINHLLFECMTTFGI